MARYSKNFSMFIMKNKHTNTSKGTIWERDWTTLGERHRLEPGKRVFYGDNNFLFTDNAISLNKRRATPGEWVGRFTYNDTIGVKSVTTKNVFDFKSDNLTDYCYFGSLLKLIEVSVYRIIENFPGRISVGDAEFTTSGDNSVHRYYISNGFDIDFTGRVKEGLRDFANNWHKYEVLFDGSTTECDSVGCRKNIVDYGVVVNDLNKIKFDKYYQIGDVYVGMIGNKIYNYNKNTGFYEYVGSLDENNYFCIGECGECLYIENGDFYYGDGCRGTKCEYKNMVPIDTCIPEYSVIYEVEIKLEGDCNDIDTIHIKGLYDYGDIIWVSDENGYKIQPKQKYIDEYFDGLRGFERLLLNRDTTPLYKNIFRRPYYDKKGFLRTKKESFVWPSNDYCIDVSSSSFDGYINKLISLGEVYDEIYTNNLYRNMTHETIKNFDWYLRNNDDGDDVAFGAKRMESILSFYGFVFDELRTSIEGIKWSKGFSYNGFKECAKQSVLTNMGIKGWDVVSLDRVYYEYVKVDDIGDIDENSIEVVQELPLVVTKNSPLYLNLDNTGFYKKSIINNNVLKLDRNNFNGCNEELLSIEKCSNWVTTDRGYFYKRITSGEEGIVYGETEGSAVLNERPSYCNAETPDKIKVVGNGYVEYYTKVDNDSENALHLHENWYGGKNIDNITIKDVENDFLKRLYLSSESIFRAKGTIHSIQMMLGMFGFSSKRFDITDDDMCGDYDFEIHEHYLTVKPLKEDSVFYYYRRANENDVQTGDGFSLFSTVPLANANSDDVIYVGDVDNYVIYVKDSVGGVQACMENIQNAKAEADGSISNYYLDGVAVRDFDICGEKHYVPYYDKNGVYYDNIYFQSKGGWFKESLDGSICYDYNETVNYLPLQPTYESLFSINPFSVREGDIFYVHDISGYMEYNQTIPNDISHFFILRDKNNISSPESWVYIPMSGGITNSDYIPSTQNGATYDEYRRAKYMESVIFSNFGNNPHVGFGSYDLGNSFIDVMKKPFKYCIDNGLLSIEDDDTYVNMANNFTFNVSDRICDNDKIKILTNHFEYVPYVGSPTEYIELSQYEFDNYGKITNSSPNILKVENTFYKKTVICDDSDKKHYYLNDKLLVINNKIDNYYHKDFFKNVVMKFVAQVIPSTTILVVTGL